RRPQATATPDRIGRVSQTCGSENRRRQLEEPARKAAVGEKRHGRARGWGCTGGPEGPTTTAPRRGRNAGAMPDLADGFEGARRWGSAGWRAMTRGGLRDTRAVMRSVTVMARSWPAVPGCGAGDVRRAVRGVRVVGRASTVGGRRRVSGIGGGA